MLIFAFQFIPVMKRILLAFLVITGALSLNAQSAFTFTDISANTEHPEIKTVLVDMGDLKKQLARAPEEFSRKKSRVRIDLPLPDGRSASYSVWDADQLPAHDDINSYRLESEFGSGRLETSPQGMSAVIQGPDGYFIIDAIDADRGLYEVAKYAEYMEIIQDAYGVLGCGFDDFAAEIGDVEPSQTMGEDAGAKFGIEKAGNMPRELRVYDLIMTNTGEFARRNGQTAESVLAAFNTSVNTINAILEPQIGVRMNLIEVPGLIYLDPDTDPYTNATTGTALLGQVIGAFEANNVGADTYDLGHILTSRCTDVGGVVSGAACSNGKTRGVTCVSGSVVGAALRIMAHEVAHQFAVSHSWNNCPGVENQRASGTAFEPGSGTTIMSYAGTCGSQNIGAESPYYHSGSVEQFANFTRTGGAAGCATVIETDNISPVVSIPYTDGFTIPVSTPFKLEGSATDANDDELLFNWEQFDLGPASPILEPRGNVPTFRSFAPTEEGNVRFFPRYDRLVNGINDRSEILIDYSRTMTFRLTAHDFDPQAGAVDWQTVQFFTDESAGPFIVNNPAESIWRVGDYREITWDVANTDKAPINCQNVNILLSTDNASTFDMVIAENVPNTGSFFFTVPAEAQTFDARIMIEAADNIFLNVNSNEFGILEANTPGYTLDTDVRFQELCLPNTLVTELTTSSILGFDNAVSLSVVEDSLPTGVLTSLSASSLVPGESSMFELDFADVRFQGDLNVTFMAVTKSLVDSTLNDTIFRQIPVRVIDNDYSDLVTNSPAEGTGGIILSTSFDWTDAVNADLYDIQISTSPAFEPDSIVEEAIGLSLSEYNPIDFFGSNRLYFWRIRPENDCGPGEWLTTQSFRTENVDCQEYFPDDLEVTLPNRGGLVRESILFVEDEGIIDDVNIPNITLRYIVSGIRVRLISPAGTSVMLYDRSCRVTNNNFRVGFDDDALDAITCPPDDNRVQLPVGQLSDFNGEQIFGEWRLELELVEAGGNGALEKWSVEFCSATSAEAPARIANTATSVPPLRATAIQPENLQVTSDIWGSRNITYTLTEMPAFGELLFYGEQMQLGDVFTQAHVNSLGIKYENTNGDIDTDLFRFVVTTPDGGYLPIVDHSILIDEDALVVSTENADALDNGLEVFPNPVAGDLNIRWSAEVTSQLTVELFDLNGRRLRTQQIEGAAKNTTLNTAGLPSGIYLVRIGGVVRRIVKQ